MFVTIGGCLPRPIFAVGLGLGFLGFVGGLGLCCLCKATLWCLLRVGWLLEEIELFGFW